MVDDNTILPTPQEPHPEPIVPVSSTTEAVKEPTISVDEILGNSPTIIPSDPPSLVVPSQTLPSSADIKPKKKNMAGIIVGLILFLGVVATGAYFVAKPESLADLRSSAACLVKKTVKPPKIFKNFIKRKPRSQKNKEAEEEPVSETQSY